MVIKEALKEKGHPFIIPDCSRDDLPSFFKEMGYKTGAEIGVYMAGFTEKLCKSGLNIYGIDPWIPYGGGGKAHNTQPAQDALFINAINKLKKYANFSVIRKTSMDALADFKDGSLDFVYIDGDHRFEYVAEDIVNWSRKVRTGGIVSGHDYKCTDPAVDKLLISKKLHLQVGAIVDAYVRAFGIENFYALGRSKPLREEALNDIYLSWFWIKSN